MLIQIKRLNENTLKKSYKCAKCGFIHLTVTDIMEGVDYDEEAGSIEASS